jgi:hypothetical protein
MAAIGHRFSRDTMRSWMHHLFELMTFYILAAGFRSLPSSSGLRTYGFRNGISFHFIIHFRPHNLEHPPSILAITNVELDKDTLLTDTVVLGYVGNFSCHMI